MARGQVSDLGEMVKEIEESLERAMLEARNRIEELKQQAGLARGTRDLSKQAVAATGVDEELTLEERIKKALTAASLDVHRLSSVLKIPREKVQQALEKFASDGQIYNVSSVERPIWTWRVGDASDGSELRAAIERLVSERPMSTADLVSATGARLTRVSGCMVAIQRTPEFIGRLIDTGPGGTSPKVWFLLPAQPRHASLEPRGGGKRRK